MTDTGIPRVVDSIGNHLAFLFPWRTVTTLSVAIVAIAQSLREEGNYRPLCP